jgi:hypothetical protein
MSLISVYAPASISFRRPAARWRLPISRRVKLLAAAALLLFAAAQLWQALRTPAQAIRDELAAAADDTAALPWNTPPDQVQRAVADHFSNRAVRIDPARFPVDVSVELSGLDRETCLGARRSAGRLEGSVVVALEGYANAADCGARNAMTWHIMP